MGLVDLGKLMNLLDQGYLEDLLDWLDLMDELDLVDMMNLVDLMDLMDLGPDYREDCSDQRWNYKIEPEPVHGPRTTSQTLNQYTDPKLQDRTRTQI